MNSHRRRKKLKRGRENQIMMKILKAGRKRLNIKSGKIMARDKQAKVKAFAGN